MPRTKNYDREIVVQKALNTFWKNGYENTSMQLLEKEMGINKFSIYDSFGSKEGLLEASIQYYTLKLNSIIDKLKKSDKGLEAIKQYFYDFAAFSLENNQPKGCLVTNTANEMMPDCKNNIRTLLTNCTSQVRNAFAQKLLEANKFSPEEIEQKADYLLVAKAGFSSATKMFSDTQVSNYLNHIFKNL